MTETTTIRVPRAEDIDELADLKIEWAQVPAGPSDQERTAFADRLAQWIAAMDDSLACRVAEVDGVLVGMAWMVFFERVPDLVNQRRLTADIQSVFVRPAHREKGIGAALIAELCSEADARGAARTTVSANERALPLYRGAGFASTPVLLERQHPAVAAGRGAGRNEGPTERPVERA